MRQFFSFLRSPSLAVMFLLLPARAPAQTPKSSTPPLGWGSSWTEPANENQRRRQELARQYRAAEDAGKFSVAADLCTRWLQQSDREIEVYGLRADAYRHLKRYDLALADGEHGRALAESRNLRPLTAHLWVTSAEVHVAMGRYPAAVAELQTSLKLDGESASALNALAWLRATAPDATVRDGREGVRLARKAVAQAPPGQAYVTRDTLAAAYAEANDFAQATDTEKVALQEAAHEIHDATRAKTFQKDAADRLQLFEQHQAFHTSPP